MAACAQLSRGAKTIFSHRFDYKGLQQEIVRRTHELKFRRECADLSIVSSLPETPVLDTPVALLALVRDFDRDTVANRKLMSDFLEREPEVFYRQPSRF